MITAGSILKGKEIDTIWVSPETTIYESVEKMNSHKIGAILIKENDLVVGIWTERDLLYNTMIEDFNPRVNKIGDFMTKNLVKSSHETTLYSLLDLFLGRRLRHVIIEKEEKFLGLLSIGDVVKACLQEKDRELKTLNNIASWNYYEDWGLKPK